MGYGDRVLGQSADGSPSVDQAKDGGANVESLLDMSSTPETTDSLRLDVPNMLGWIHVWEVGRLVSLVSNINGVIMQELLTQYSHMMILQWL